MEELKDQILRLACSADMQISLYPDGVCIGDELVMDLDRNIAGCAIQLEPSQSEALATLDSYIAGLSGPENASFWCDIEPLRTDVRWAKIRALSQRVVELMRWVGESAKRDGATYVFEGRVEKNS